MSKRIIECWMRSFAEVIADNKDYLNELDSPIGDGDHGTNMDRGMIAVVEALESKEFASNAEDLKTVGMTLLSKVGGASGPLFGSAFLSMSKALEDDLITSHSIQASVDAIKKRGKSDVNEKTMLDVWQPLIPNLEQNNLSVELLEHYAQSTEAMKATKGRASFLGERSRGHRDPGAQSSKYLFATGLDEEVFT